MLLEMEGRPELHFSPFFWLEYSIEGVVIFAGVLRGGPLFSVKIFFSLAPPLPLPLFPKRSFRCCCSLLSISFLTFSSTELNWIGCFVRSVFALPTDDDPPAVDSVKYAFETSFFAGSDFSGDVFFETTDAALENGLRFSSL